MEGVFYASDQVEPTLDPIEPVVHTVAAQPHLRNFADNVRDAVFDATEPAALLPLLFSNLANSSRIARRRQILGLTSSDASLKRGRGRFRGNDGIGEKLVDLC
jgi:hypothetical protein